MTPRGGMRPNAGRKPGDPAAKRARIAHTIPPDLLAWLTRRAVRRRLSRSEALTEILEEARANDPDQAHDAGTDGDQ